MPQIPSHIKTQSLDLKEAYGLLGSKLGFYIASIDLSAETKDALYDMLPHMSLSQLERFVAILEAQYLNVATDDMDKRFASELAQVQEAFDIEQKALDVVATKKIQALTQSINKK